MNVHDELTTLAEALAAASARGPIDAFCLIATGDDEKDEAAYWSAVRLGAQRCGFWIVGRSARIKLIDAEHGKITEWIDDISHIPEGNIVVLGKRNLDLQ